MITFTYEELEEMDIPGFADAMQSAEKRGKKLGQKLGEEAGKKKQAAAMLTKLLSANFGRLPAWAKQQIADADLKTLDRWMLRVIGAEGLEDVLKEKKSKTQ